MAWGFFKKIQKGASDSAKFLKNTIIPVGKQIIKGSKDIYDIARPIVEATGWGKSFGDIIDKSNDAIDYADDISETLNAKDFKTGLKRGVDLYQRSKNYK